MDVQVIHYQMDGLGFRILKGQLKNDLCELDRRAIRCGKCEVAARLWLYRAENIGCAAAFIFVVSSRFPSRLCWRSRPDVGMQGNRLLIQTPPPAPGDRKAFHTSPEHLPF